MSLGPVVAGAALSEHKVVRAEDLSEGPGADAVHGAGLQVHQDRPRDVLPAARLVVVHIDPLQLEVRVPVVGAGGVDTVLIGDDLPELKTRKRLEVVVCCMQVFRIRIKQSLWIRIQEATLPQKLVQNKKFITGCSGCRAFLEKRYQYPIFGFIYFNHESEAI